MAKKAKRKGMGLAIFMVVYALAALTGIFFGLKWFWGYMEAYEASRPHVTIDAYMATISREAIVDRCDVIIEKADLNIQSEEECRKFLENAISGEITYARKASECTDTVQTYVLRSGGQVIGSFSIEAGPEDAYGFTPWHLRKENFDLSYLMGAQTVSVTVPQGYGVWVNGVKLDESYILEEQRRDYALLENFYKSYDLPQLVLQTYQAGPFLDAEYQMEVYDPEGRPFVMDESFDENVLIELKDEEKILMLEAYVEEFLDVYVLFAGCANDLRYSNFNKVMKYVVPDSTLAQRMTDAMEGLEYAQSRGDKVVDIQIHHLVEMVPGIYMCDVTYLVDTTGHDGVVQVTNNVKMVVVKEDGKLLVESMIGY